MRILQKVMVLTALYLGGIVSGALAAKLPPLPVDETQGLSRQSVNILGSRMSYLEDGQGEVVIFLHGNPTSSYLWRNVIPQLHGQYHSVAPDLIGMGNSSKPDIPYSFDDHYHFLVNFINKLKVDKVRLVTHDWGAALGFYYAAKHPEKVSGIAFMEGLLPPIFPQPSFEAMGPEMGGMFKAFKDPQQGVEMVINNNMFIEQVLPGFVNRNLSDIEMNTYRAPYVDPAARAPVLAWPRAVPIAGEPQETVKVLVHIKTFMAQTDIPILLVYAEPGVLVNEQVRQWYKSTIKNLETAYVGQGLHFIQEDQPLAIGRAVEDWLRRH